MADARIIRVFVSSPGDVSAERAVLDEVVDRINKTDGQLLGLALGHVGDPRIVTDLRDDAGYVEIPAGTYAYQDGKQQIKKPFLLSRYPVTNSQYALFIEEKGYEQRKWWSQEGWKWREGNNRTEPDSWRDAIWNAPNQLLQMEVIDETERRRTGGHHKNLRPDPLVL